MIDFEYNKIIVVKYSLGSGGKFLVNSLSLNENAVFQSEKLSSLQINKKFNVREKILYLNHHLNISKNNQQWNDLGLNEKDFFGIEDHEYLKIDEKLPKNIKYKEVVQKCIENDKFIFLTIHENLYLYKILKIWKNSKLIKFKNEKKIIEYRNKNILKSSIDYYYQNNKIDDIDNGVIIPTPYYEWDCEWYFSEQKTIEKIKELYDILGIDGFNEKVISWYYKKWMESIK